MPTQSHNLACSLALGVAAALLILGGAGDTVHLVTAAAQSLALALIGLIVVTPTLARGKGQGPLILLLLLICALPLVHLIPLPADLLSGLPGHEPANILLTLSGAEQPWRPLSLDPQMTIETGLELLPLIAGLLIGWQAGPTFRRRLVLVIVGVALFSALLGGWQRVTGEGLFAAAGSADVAAGIFINRNHQALFLVMSLPLVAWLSTTSAFRAGGGRTTGWILAGGIGLVLAVGALATGSRAGLLMLPLALLACWQVAAPKNATRLLMPALIGVTLLSSAVLQSQVAFRPVERFIETGEDGRTLMREKSQDLVRAYWPAGSGLGTFVRVWPQVEPQEAIMSAYVNHAHHDYLELLAEGGALPVGLAVLGLGTGSWAWRRRGRQEDERQARETRGLRTAALAGLGLIALHSLVDFPMRMMGIGLLAGMLLAFLLSPGSAPAPATRKQPRNLAWRAGALVLLVSLLYPVWGLALSRTALAGKEPALALRAWPWSSEAHTDLGFEALGRGEGAEAIAQARQAIADAPLNARAYALLVAALEARGEQAKAMAILDATRALGSREPRLEYRRMEVATDEGDYVAAARHADVLLRQEAYRDEVIDFARSLATDPVGLDGMTRVLAGNPPWRTGFLTQLATLRPDDAGGHAALLARLAGTQAPPRAAEINAALARLGELGLDSEAASLARRSGRVMAGRLLPEPRAMAGASPAGFGWTIRGGTGGDVYAEPDQPQASERFRLTARSTMLGPALSRRLMLPPGPVSLKWTGVEETTGSAQGLGWTLRCEGSSDTLVPLATKLLRGANGRIESESRFQVPQGCRLPTLSAVVNWQDRGDLGLLITSVELR